MVKQIIHHQSRSCSNVFVPNYCTSLNPLVTASPSETLKKKIHTVSFTEHLDVKIKISVPSVIKGFMSVLQFKTKQNAVSQIEELCFNVVDL